MKSLTHLPGNWMQTSSLLSISWDESLVLGTIRASQKILGEAEIQEGSVRLQQHFKPHWNSAEGCEKCKENESSVDGQTDSYTVSHKRHHSCICPLRHTQAAPAMGQALFKSPGHSSAKGNPVLTELVV